ncbi:MAG: hypothetical protein FJ398_09435 [Verrucomicrobia bacterium]|nr:hypothetical protein [Verrucomicrobiota bacterium]
MKTYTLEPQDLLFFRDARPMETSGGHGARWPEPSVIFDALHAALWRAFPEKRAWEHKHDYGRSSHRPRNGDTQRFGSLVSAGLFAVWTDGRWLFPAPADATASDDTDGWLLVPQASQGSTNLPAPFLKCTVASRAKPSKETVQPWWSTTAWRDYLAGQKPARAELFSHDDLFAAEWTTGIGIDPETQTQDGQRIYSAEYLRLRPKVRCGFTASLRMKHNGSGRDLRECIEQLFEATDTIIVGGQQRPCRVEPSKENATPPFPLGMSRDFHSHGEAGNQRLLVKWILLTPAIWPEIKPGFTRSREEIRAHPGGWLPNWICPNSGKVLLHHRPGEVRRVWDETKGRTVRRADNETNIAAHLVAACVPKPTPVTGWTERLHLLQDEREKWAPGGDDKAHGPRQTHLAVPAGAVYYFEADSETDARNLAAALNWHGGQKSEIENPKAEIRMNRRSTLMGEKGFGLGVCGTWKFFGT